MKIIVYFAENFESVFSALPLILFTASVLMIFQSAYRCIFNGQDMHKGKLIYLSLLMFASYSAVQLGQSISCVKPSETIYIIFIVVSILMIILSILLLLITFFVLHIGKGNIKTSTLIIIFLFILSSYISNMFAEVYSIPQNDYSIDYSIPENGEQTYMKPQQNVPLQEDNRTEDQKIDDQIIRPTQQNSQNMK